MSSQQSGYYNVEIVNPSTNYPIEIVYTDPSGQQQTFNISYGSSTQGYIFVSEEDPTIQVIVQKFAGGFVVPSDASQETIEEAMQNFIGDTQNVVCYKTPQPNNQVGYICYKNIPCYSFTVSGSGTITLDLNKINQCAGHTQENGYYLPNQEIPTIAPPTGNPEYISDELGWMYPVQVDGVTIYSAWNKVYIPESSQQNLQQLVIDICGNNPNAYIYTNPNGAYRWYCGDVLKQIQASQNNQSNQNNLIPNNWSPDLVNQCKSQGMNGSVTVDGITIPCNLILTPQCFQPATICVKGGANKISIYEMFENPSGYCNQVEATSIMASGTPTSDCFIVPKPVDVGASESTDIYFNVKPKAGKVLTNIPRLALGSAWNYQLDLNSLGQDNTSNFPSDVVSYCQNNPNGTATYNGVQVPCQVVLAQTNNSSELYGRTGQCFKTMPVCFNQPGTFTVKYIWTEPVCGVQPGATLATGTLTEPGCVQVPVVNDGLNDPAVVIDFTAQDGKEYTQYLSSYFMTVTIGEPSSSSSSNSNSTTSSTTTPITQELPTRIPYTVGRYLSGTLRLEGGSINSNISPTKSVTSPSSRFNPIAGHYLSKASQLFGNTSSSSTTQGSQNMSTNNTSTTQGLQMPTGTKPEPSRIQAGETHTHTANPVGERLLTEPPGFRPEPSHIQNKEENTMRNQNKKPEMNVSHKEVRTPTTNPVNARFMHEPVHPIRPKPQHPLNREEPSHIQTNEPRTPTATPVNIRLLDHTPGFRPEPSHPHPIEHKQLPRPEPSHPIKHELIHPIRPEHYIPRRPIEQVNEREIKHSTKRNVKKEEHKNEREEKHEEEKEKRHLELY